MGRHQCGRQALARTVVGVWKGRPSGAVAHTVEVIPMILVYNCGGNATRVLGVLRVSGL